MQEFSIGLSLQLVMFKRRRVVRGHCVSGIWHRARSRRTDTQALDDLTQVGRALFEVPRLYDGCLVCILFLVLLCG